MVTIAMDMYNKIFTKILDSSIWLEPTTTRIVWITLIAAMDEVGFCAFAAVGNVAGRARVSEAEARAALEVLEGPDRESSDQENKGRRIERVPGGWLVLNAPKYRAMVTRVNIQEKTRARVQKFREKKRRGNASVTDGNDDVRLSNEDSYAETRDKDLLPRAAQRLPAVGGKFYVVTQEQVDHWTELYPAVDVMQELRNMLGWLEATPSRKKTTSGMARFITGWLSKAQNRGPGKTNGRNYGTKQDGVIEQLREIREDQRSASGNGDLSGGEPAEGDDQALFPAVGLGKHN